DKEITETEDQSYNSTIDTIDVNESIIDDFTEQTSNQNTLQEQEVSSQTQTYTYRDIQLMSDAISKFEKLFSKCIFYLSREVPKYSLEFVIRSFGGLVGWDDTVEIGSPFKEDDERITHHIIDRPITKELIPTRVYIQPQWVYDCINAKNLLNTKPYQPGKALPPHLSPFVEYEDGDYIPVNDAELEGNEGNEENEENVEQKIKIDIKNENTSEGEKVFDEDEDTSDVNDINNE
ncbi:2315_t:CDS:2, partial [Dentiscutata erythropus]